jgi:hypothetical protein
VTQDINGAEITPIEKRVSGFIKDLSQQTPRKYIVAVEGGPVPGHFMYADEVVMAREGVELHVYDKDGAGECIAGFTPGTDVAFWLRGLVHELTREIYVKHTAEDLRKARDMASAADADVAAAQDTIATLAQIQRKQVKDEAQRMLATDKEKGVAGIPIKTGQYV